MLSAERRLINLPPNNASRLSFSSLFLSLRCLLPALRCRVFYFVEEISIVTEVLRVSSSPSVDCVAPFSPLRAESLLFFLPSFLSFSFPFYLHLGEIQRNGWKIDRESRSPSSSLVRVELAIIRKRSLQGIRGAKEEFSLSRRESHVGFILEYRR